jgi:hypothetical protein
MQAASMLNPFLKQGVLLALAAALMFAGAEALAQNLDQGKSAVRLFADSCVTCHHNPRGLAKGRYRVTLFMYLQDHYASSSSSAWELASYLASLDTPPRSRGRTASAHSSAAAGSKSSGRPPASVPQH